MTRSRGDDDGLASVVTVAVIALLLGVVALGAVATDLLAARRRAAAAADLGALAGAPVAPHGEGEACRVAAWIVRENGASATACRVVDGDVWVTAAAVPRGPWARWLDGLADGPVEIRMTGRAGLR